MQHERVKSAARIIEIFEFFSERRAPARLSEICAALSYPASSLTALLRTLVDMGYIEFDRQSHGYFPTLRLSRLTAWMEVGGYEQTAVLDAMYKLRDAVEEPVVLAAPHDLHIDYTQSLHRGEGTNSHISPGSRRLMIQNGIGWLMLARRTEAEARSVYRRTVSEGLISADRCPEAALLEIVARHRESEVSVLHARDLCEPTAHWNASMISILIPVPPGHHRALGIGVHGPTPRMIEKTGAIRAHLADLAVTLHRQLADAH